MTVKTMQEAWNEADRLMKGDYEYDITRSARAGYPIYYSTHPELHYEWISDLGDRLEVNMANGKSVNIWIEAPKEKTFEEMMIEKGFQLNIIGVWVQKGAFA